MSIFKYTWVSQRNQAQGGATCAPGSNKIFKATCHIVVAELHAEGSLPKTIVVVYVCACFGLISCCVWDVLTIKPSIAKHSMRMLSQIRI